MINNSADDLVFLDAVGEAFVSGPGNIYSGKGNGKSAVEINQTYYNNLPCDVTIVDKHGIRHVCPKALGGNELKFTIRTTYTIGEAAYSDLRRLFAGQRGTMNTEMKIICTRLTSGNAGDFQRQLIISIDHCVTYDQLLQCHGNVYVRDADTVVSLHSLEDAQAHPRAFGTVSERAYVESLGSGVQGFAFGLGIVMVDRRPGSQVMYTFLMNQVKTIPVCKDTSKTEGFYITTLERSAVKENGQNLVPLHYLLEDANKIGIWASREQAISAGDVKLLREEEMLRLKHDSERAKIEAATDKATFERETAERQRLHVEEVGRINRESAMRDQIHDTRVLELKEQNAEADRRHEDTQRGAEIAVKERERVYNDHIRSLQREREEANNRYEMIASGRKDWTEYLKIISGTITTMGVLIVAFNKAFGK